MACDQIARIHAFYDGELPVGEHEAIEAHLRSCDECAALLTDLRQLSRMIDEAPLVDSGELVFARLTSRVRSASQERSVLRITKWMSAAAAGVAVFFMLHGSPVTDIQSANAAEWETSMETASNLARSDARTAEPGSELVQSAQWMATGLETFER